MLKEQESRNILFYMENKLNELEETEEEYVLHDAHTQFEKKLIQIIGYRLKQVSFHFEKWSTHRIKLIKNLADSAKKLEMIKLNTGEGKLISSFVDVLGTTASLILKDVSPSLAHVAFATATVTSCLSFSGTVLASSLQNHTLNDVYKLLHEDQKRFKDVIQWFKLTEELDDVVQRIFPYNINMKLLDGINWESTFKENYQNSLNNVIQKMLERKHEDVKDEDIERKQIVLTVFILNYLNNPQILEDEDFLLATRTFSNSTLAKLWWTRLHLKETLRRISTDPSWLPQLKSMKPTSGISRDTFPLFSLPLLKFPWIPQSSMVLLSSLAAFDAYCEVRDDKRIEEAELLRKIARCLKIEFDALNKLYEKFISHCD